MARHSWGLWTISWQSPAPLASREGMSHSPLAPWGVNGDPHESQTKSCFSPWGLQGALGEVEQTPLPFTGAPQTGASIPWAGPAPALASCRDSTEPALLTCHPSRTKPASAPNCSLCFAGLLRKICSELGMVLPPGQGGDAALCFPMQVWQSSPKSCFFKDGFVLWEIQSARAAVTCNFGFFCCKNIDFSARSLNCSSKHFIAWVGEFPSAFKSTFPLKMSLREGCFF